MHYPNQQGFRPPPPQSSGSNVLIIVLIVLVVVLVLGGGGCLLCIGLAASVGDTGEAEMGEAGSGGIDRILSARSPSHRAVARAL